jgi:hypothetical protein
MIRKVTNTPFFCVYAENDIYMFRQFPSKQDCYLIEGDFAFALDSELWNLVVRQRDENIRQDPNTQRTVDAVGWCVTSR